MTPKSGWDNYIKQLLSLQILTLPDEKNLAGYNGCGEDGLPYYFEVATNKFEEATEVEKIANLLEAEFSFTNTK
jgi:hypothetical protein